MKITIVCLISVLLCFASSKNSDTDEPVILCEPYGARIALGYYYTQNNATNITQSPQDQLVINFNTNNTCNASLIISNGQQNQTITLNETKLLNMSQIYENNTEVQYTYQTYIQQFVLSNLTEGSVYQYYIFGNQSTSNGPYSFRVPFRDERTQQRIVFFGDIDSNWNPPNRSQYTFDWFQAQAQQNASQFDLLMMMGDLAYDLESEDCSRGDYFLRNISQTMSSTWPVLVTPGNHDAGNNTYFPMVRELFWSPQQSYLNTETVYYNFYSFNLGLAHFIHYNPYYIVYGKISQMEVYNTLLETMAQDLAKAQQNRKERPWIIVVSHYPLYCSDYENYQCALNRLFLQQFADLFQLNQVDLYISGHLHDYERENPIYDGQLAYYENLDEGHVIENAGAPLFLIEGAGGNSQSILEYPSQPKPFSQFQSVNTTGVGVLTILNETHLYFEHIGTQDNNIIDYVYLNKFPNDAQMFKEPRDIASWWMIILSILAITLVLAAVVYICHRKQKHAQDQYNQMGLENELQNV